MVLYSAVLRYHPGITYLPTDEEVLADALQARLVATVFYRADIPAPAGGRRGLIDMQGGGAAPGSGLPVVDLPVSSPSTSYIAALYDQGYTIISMGYVPAPQVGGTPPSPANQFIYYPTTSALNAAIPGQTAFDPSQWDYDVTTKALTLNSDVLNRLSAEHCVVHFTQFLATFGSFFGLSQDIANDWIIGGRSFGAHLAQFVGLGPDRADVNADPASRYAKSTRYRGVFVQQNVASWNTLTDAQPLPHWTDYSGTLLTTIGAARATTGPNGEDQIALASALYHANQDAATRELNSVTPTFILAGDPPTTAADYSYAGLVGIAPISAPHSAAAVTAMRLMLQGLTPPSGQENVHFTLSRFLIGPVDLGVLYNEQLAFLLPLLAEVTPPGRTPIGGNARTAKFSQLDVEFSWGASGALKITRQIGGYLSHTVVPTLSVTLPIDAPGIVQDPCRIDAPDDIELFKDLADGLTYPKVNVQVIERRFDSDGTQFDTRVLWAGHVDVATRNPKGRSGRVILECRDELALTVDAPLGIACNQFCQRTFGRGLCRSATTDLDTITQTGQVQAITGTAVTIAGLTPGSYPTYFRHGYVEFGDVRINVRNWTSDAPTIFELREEPPAAWLGENVSVAPGCDKTPANCESYSNAERFLGIGLVMPEYAPHYQQPPK